MSTWAIIVACYLLVGVCITEMGMRGMRKKGNSMSWWLYLIGFFVWPLVVVIAIMGKSNK